MNTNAPPQQALPSSGLRTWQVVIFGIPTILLLCAFGMLSYFRLGSEATTLRESLMTSVSGQWDKKIAINVGWFTTTLVRTGSRFFNLPQEPRAALEAVRAAEVGVYKLRQAAAPFNALSVLFAADEKMKARGWERLVGVSKDQDVVAIYVPRKGCSETYMRCCLMVLNDRNLVVVSARANLKPLLALADKHLRLDCIEPQFSRL